MRYWKGSIHLSPSQDYPLLRQILRSDHITHSQLFEFMRLGSHESCRQSFAWRVRRLVSHGVGQAAADNLVWRRTRLLDPSGGRPGTPRPGGILRGIVQARPGPQHE